MNKTSARHNWRYWAAATVLAFTLTACQDDDANIDLAGTSANGPHTSAPEGDDDNAGLGRPAD